VSELIKQLNWGFFSGMTRATHQKLWKELILSDNNFPDSGDIKRTLTIANLFICMLDIHGYTKFCQESKKNISMLHALDRTINKEIRQISANCGCVSQRERGDEIVVVAASATDAVTVTLAIMDYFANTKVIDDPAISIHRTDEAATLPPFKISAGISGGNTSTPLIITQQGNLSGFLLNTGARLQARADELSPKESRIMATRQVAIKFEQENAANPKTEASNSDIFFFDTGTIEFKGVQLPTCEIVFNPNQAYKKKYEGEQKKLFESTKNKLWENQIYIDLMNLLMKISMSVPPFSLKLQHPLHELNVVDNAAMAQLCRTGMRAYVQSESYTFAIHLLHDLIFFIERIPSFDRIALDYLKGISKKYDIVLDAYHKVVEKMIQDKASTIFHGDMYKQFAAAKNGAEVYEKFLAFARKNHTDIRRKPLWFEQLQRHMNQMDFTLYSGKK
jgi:hypothetical protein